MGDGGPNLLFCGGVEVTAPAAGDGYAVPPQLIDQMAHLDALDAEGQLQFPAGGGVELSQMVLLQVFRQPFFFHSRSFPGPDFPKKGAKKEGAVPIRKTAPA